MSRNGHAESQWERKLNHLISFLQQYPTASKEQQAEELGVGVDALRKTYYKRLKDWGWAVWNPVFTEKVDSRFQKFWIFVETTYEHVRCSAPVEADVDEADFNYQLQVTDAIGDLLRTRFKGTLILDEIDIVVGADWDIIMQLQAEDPSSIHEFVTRYIRKLPHVLRTSTAWALSPHLMEMNGADHNDA